MRFSTLRAGLVIAMLSQILSAPLLIAGDSEVHWIPPCRIIGLPRGSGPAHRAAADRLAAAFGGSVITVERNPVCCIWLELRLPVPNPGKPGYIVLHQGGGSTITASDQQRLDEAVTRVIATSKLVEGVRMVPEGVLTSFPVVARQGRPTRQLERTSFHLGFGHGRCRHYHQLSA